MADDAAPDLEPDLELAVRAGAVGGAVGYAILRWISERGPSTTRELLRATAPLGTHRQTSVEKIVKRLQRDGLTDATSEDGVAHYELTLDGEAVVAGMRAGSAGPLDLLGGLRLLLVRVLDGSYADIARALEEHDSVIASVGVDGDYDFVALCEDQLQRLRDLRDRIREVGGESSGARVTQ